MIQSLLRWIYYFPWRCQTRLTAWRLTRLGVDFSTDVDRRFPSSIGYAYQPPYNAFFRDGIRSLPIPVKDVKLFDAGCGKGPILYYAKQMGIPQVGGVEYSGELYAITVKNMQALGYSDVIVYHNDATLLKDELDEFNVFYMFNPFPAEPMRAFMRAIVESVRRNQRHVWLIYHNPIFADVCREAGFIVYQEVLTHTYFGNDKPTLILEYGSESEHDASASGR